jgi:hypothetical protein
VGQVKTEAGCFAEQLEVPLVAVLVSAAAKRRYAEAKISEAATCAPLVTTLIL